MTEKTESKTNQILADRARAVASGLFAPPCALYTPALIAVTACDHGSPFVHEAQWALTLFALASSVGALVLGWRLDPSKNVASRLLSGSVYLIAARILEMPSHRGQYGHYEEGGGERYDENEDYAQQSLCKTPALSTACSHCLVICRIVEQHITEVINAATDLPAKRLSRKEGTWHV